MDNEIDQDGHLRTVMAWIEMAREWTKMSGDEYTLVSVESPRPGYLRADVMASGEDVVITTEYPYSTMIFQCRGRSYPRVLPVELRRWLLAGVAPQGEMPW